MLIDTIRNGLAVLSIVPDVRPIHDSCTKDWLVRFRHVMRDSNNATDRLATTELRSLNKVIIYQNLPQNVIFLFEEDDRISLLNDINSIYTLLIIRHVYLFQKI